MRLLYFPLLAVLAFAPAPFPSRNKEIRMVGVWEQSTGNVGVWEQLTGDVAHWDRRWEFKEDGTFTFTHMTWQPRNPSIPKPPPLAGKWRQEGNVLTVRFTDVGGRIVEEAVYHLSPDGPYLRGQMTGSALKPGGKKLQMPVVFRKK